MENAPTNIGFDKLVTPYQQQFGMKENASFTLMEIINNPEKLNRFQPYEFPDVDITSDGNIFIQPTKHIIRTLEDYYIKWIPGMYSNEDGFIPSHDHNYPYASIMKNQWIMKVVIQRIDLQAKKNIFEIKWFSQISDIHTMCGQDASGNTVEMVRPFQLEEFPALHNQLSNEDDQRIFFQKYISDVYSIEDEERDRNW